MSKEPLPQSIADLPAQRASAPKSKAEARALYFNTGNAFNLQLPPVPDESFTAEPAKALHRDTPTTLIACDRSKGLGCDFPATTPLVLARYARIRAGETLETNFAASGVIAYVITGKGSTLCGTERIECCYIAARRMLVLSGNERDKQRLHARPARHVDGEII